jgi:uncharacterized integral membrane protein
MWQGVALTAIFITLILFCAQNMHQARINFPFAGTFEIRTVFLLLTVFFLGYGSAYFTWILKRVKKRDKDEKR